MEEIEQIGDGWSKALDLHSIDLADMGDDVFGRVTTDAVMQEPAERSLVCRIFIDIGNA